MIINFKLSLTNLKDFYNAGYRVFSHFTIDVGDGFSDDDFGILRKCVFNDAKFRGIYETTRIFFTGKTECLSL